MFCPRPLHQLPSQVCCFACRLERSSQPPKVVKCKLKLNSSLTDSVREEFQLQFGSSHFHGPAPTVPFSAAGMSLGWLVARAGGQRAWPARQLLAV